MKFREIIINDKIILMGKNQEQNEELVNQYIGKDNIIMHTVAPGSPFCVAIEKPTPNERKQIANFCAAYSQDWRDNKKDIKVHWFSGKNVYKEKGMSIGTFGVRKAKVIIAKKEDIIKWQ
jgi:predicted ribosome quality control (RQC) complex YloA/Tae2 family protein